MLHSVNVFSFLSKEDHSAEASVPTAKQLYNSHYRQKEKGGGMEKTKTDKQKMVKKQ